MTKGNKKWIFIPAALAVVLYLFAAPRPIPEETILAPRWITSLESNYPINMGDFSVEENEAPLPFVLGDRFGYTADDGKFTVSRTTGGYVSISEDYWAEYGEIPASFRVMDPRGEPVFDVENPGGYPLFLDGRVFIVGRDQNSITALGADGERLWTYDFPAPITCVDAAGGFVLAGTLDGAMILLDAAGAQAAAPFEPGGSRLSIIEGCAISKDASRFAVISGIGEQRFLLLERSADSYRVVYHEFLGEGFRRPVHINFIDGNTKVAFEREGGIGIYDIDSRASTRVDFPGEIAVMDTSGENEFLFVISSTGAEEKRLIAIRFPGTVVNNAPFESGNVFFARRNGRLFIGGDTGMASLELEKR